MQPYFEATPGLIVTEEDVRRFILGTAKTTSFSLPKYNKLTRGLISVALLCALGYGLLNAPALWLQSRYAITHQILNQSSQTAPSLPIPGQTSQNLAQASVQPQLADNHLFIPTIDVNAPIMWDTATTNDAELNALQDGVIHLAGTAHPGEIGNTFIAGHSSYFPFAKGSYKTVFALLPKLKLGDQIQVTYHGIIYDYRVHQILTVSPDDASVLKQTTQAQLTLETCTPVGTTLHRLVVIATPTNATQFTIPSNSNGTAATTAQLPTPR